VNLNNLLQKPFVYSFSWFF